MAQGSRRPPGSLGGSQCPRALTVPLPQVSRLALSGLRNWTTAASPSAVFAARHFRPFLPPRGHVELGEPWWIIPSELSVFTGYLSNNRFYPPPPKGKEVRAAPGPHAPALHLDPKATGLTPLHSCLRLAPPLVQGRHPPRGAGPCKPTPGPTAPSAGHHPPTPEHVPPAALREDPLCPSGGRGLPDRHQRLLLHRDVPVRGPGSPVPPFPGPGTPGQHRRVQPREQGLTPAPPSPPLTALRAWPSSFAL